VPRQGHPAAAARAAAAPDTGTSSTAYQRFCYNNSDLCTVSERVVNIDVRTTYTLTCTLNSGEDQCPPAGVTIGGPYSKRS
jgi:hypothetical protein